MYGVGREGEKEVDTEREGRTLPISIPNSTGEFLVVQLAWEVVVLS